MTDQDTITPPDISALAAEVVHTEAVAPGQGYILTGTPGTTATAIFDGMLETPDGYPEIVLATIAEGSSQAAFVAPPQCGTIRIDSDMPGTASIMAANFRPALSGTSSGGGGTPAPVVIPGQKIVTGNPADKILRHGEIYHFPFTDNPIDCSFLDCTFDDSAGRVITLEAWVDTGYCAPPIDFNGGWQWVGVIPQMSKEYTSYRVTIRKVPGMTPEINYAYCVPLPQQP